MRVALYARVSTEAQEQRGTIGSQLEALRARADDEGDEITVEFCDDGHSGARLDRPGLDSLRDAAEAGLIEGVWCLSPDRLARIYAYQVIVLDELSRLDVAARFTDTPPIDDDPQAKLLTQVQGVIAEYERAKIAERYRRGKLYRSRLGEVISWRAPYGYRRRPRDADGPARLEIYEPKAEVVARIFDDYVAGGHSTRQIVHRLVADQIDSPSGKPMWSTSTISRLLRNEAYVGRVHYNRTESVPAPAGHKRATMQRPRPREDWITIAAPAIIAEDLFDAAQQVSYDNTQWSPRNTEPGEWLLRGLVVCGRCEVGTNCHKMRGRNGTWHRYYYCRNHDVLRAGGPDRRCTERNIRANELDTFGFDQVRDALANPDLLLASETALAASRPACDDELLAAQLAKLDRKLAAAVEERRRLVDLYQTGLIELVELQRRAKDVDARHTRLDTERDTLAAERAELATDNQLRHRVGDFARRTLDALDTLDFDQRQKLLCLAVEQVHVTGWHVEIRLRIPLDPPPDRPPPNTPGPQPRPGPSSDMRLRSIGGHRRRQHPPHPSHRRQGGDTTDPMTRAAPLAVPGQFCWPRPGTSTGHRWADPTDR